MKQCFSFLAVVALLAVMPASAQVRFGLKGGANTMDMDFDDDVFNSKHRYGWFAGPSLKVDLPLHLGADIAALYEQKQAKLNGESIRQKSIVIPVNARLNLVTLAGSGVYLAAGPQFGFNVGDKKFEWSDDNDEIHNTFQLKKSSFSLNLGAGLYIADYLELGIIYNIAMGTTGDATFRDTLKEAASKSTYKDDTKSKTLSAVLCVYF